MPDFSGPLSVHAGRLYIGLMSGTSLDGADGVLVRLGDPGTSQSPEVLATAALAMPASLRDELYALNRPGDDELHRAALASQELAKLYARTVQTLLDDAQLPAAAVRAIGAHGQTVRHRPELGYTLQLNAPALLAELTGIDVVADFRSRDVAAGGQGAPLVPPFHAAMFGTDFPRAVLNLGGIANITLLAPGKAPRGFDTGPANVLLDLWCQRHTGQAYDKDGAWAQGGRVDAGLLEHLVATEPWLAVPPPKSTGRDLFNAQWLDARLSTYPDVALLSARDIQATLQRFTARTVADALQDAAPESRDVLVCGGGARNAGLMRDLADCLQRPLQPTDAAGVPAQWVEAMAFAWLAHACVERLPAGVPEVTGARGTRVLGAIYPA
ncbi:anhydro-N-acetylmuramic acid kinase [Bordetella sp. 02P26C-1]|uniref:anhydro-N-acetylmuramic acid kinase n=1 Tax=Bordetella sp. 02P26C-1 TaxID=2683195 RepID=UPI0013557A08|nr:anhydro-N-acetylmuramic acid kinase [Bordetella sp. 02P26C-1]MVW78339.1 anhydro-N-acetylmuramic acid kinase [Bordetella sp. 02P26C-1]